MYKTWKTKETDSVWESQTEKQSWKGNNAFVEVHGRKHVPHEAMSAQGTGNDLCLTSTSAADFQATVANHFISLFSLDLNCKEESTPRV